MSPVQTKQGIAFIGQKRKLLVLFFFCSLIWIWISAVLLLFVPFDTREIPQLLLGAALLSAAIPILFVHTAMLRLDRFKRWIEKGEDRWLLFLIVLAGFSGNSLLLFALMTETPINVVLLFIGQVLNGVALSFALMQAHRLFRIMQVKFTLALASASICFAVLTTSSAKIFGIKFLFYPLPLLPLLVIVTLKSLGRLPSIFSSVTSESPPRIGKPIRHVLSSLIIGLSFGFFVSFMLLELFSAFSRPALICAELIALSCSGLLLYVTRHTILKAPNDAVFQIGIPLLSSSFLLLILLPTWIPAYSIQLFGAIYTISVGISMMPLLSRSFGVSAVYFLRNADLVFLGYGLGFSVRAFTPENFRTQTLALLVFFLLLACVLLTKERKLKLGWIDIDTMTEEFSRDFFSYSCEVLGRENSFTAREQEVFVRLASGHNRKSIARQLTVSEETVKSHFKNIYRKLAVHNQQQAIELVYAKCGELEQSE